MHPGDERQKITPPEEEQPLLCGLLRQDARVQGKVVRTVAELRHAGIRAEMAYGDRSAEITDEAGQ